jgi:hypothetical protein
MPRQYHVTQCTLMQDIPICPNPTNPHCACLLHDTESALRCPFLTITRSDGCAIRVLDLIFVVYVEFTFVERVWRWKRGEETSRSFVRLKLETKLYKAGYCPRSPSVQWKTELTVRYIRRSGNIETDCPRKGLPGS